MRQWARGEARQLFTAIYGLWQSASGARVAIPVGGPLKSALDDTPKRSTLILTSSDNKPWTEDGFAIVMAQSMRDGRHCRADVP